MPRALTNCPPLAVAPISSRRHNSYPALRRPLSRPDIIKAAQQLPGIEAATEASSLMIVRGGNPGENLYMLDNVPLIYVNHLGGFMSVFNSEMINTMDIYKGGFPARYGGKLSSIVDLTAKKGDPTKLKGSLSAGLTDLAFAVEGPGGLKNSSFIVTGRKTLTEALLYIASQISKGQGGQDYNMAYGFHDINAKYTWSPDAKNSFCASGKARRKTVTSSAAASATFGATCSFRANGTAQSAHGFSWPIHCLSRNTD